MANPGSYCVTTYQNMPQSPPDSDEVNRYVLSEPPAEPLSRLNYPAVTLWGFGHPPQRIFLRLRPTFISLFLFCASRLSYVCNNVEGPQAAVSPLSTLCGLRSSLLIVHLLVKS